jgi:hypothetical protein
VGAPDVRGARSPSGCLRRFGVVPDLVSCGAEVWRFLGFGVRDLVQGSRHRLSCSTTSTTRRSPQWVTYRWPRNGTVALTDRAGS